MPFSFKVEKPKDVGKTLEMLKKGIAEQGGKGDFVEGDEKSERAAIQGVEGRYKVEAEYIELTIDKKPFAYPKAAVEKYIKEQFRKLS